MLSFPNAKINLGLNIVSKRTDGYHNIESCFYPVPWCDALEIIPANELTFTTSGLPIPGDRSSNLCLKAYHLLQSAHQIPNVYIHLHKVIPMGAGLGGGSADGAFALKMLNELFELELSIGKLQEYAAQLGSDCPFFIQNKPVFATGKGTDFQEIPLNLHGKYIAIKHPGVHISTKEAYAGVTPGAADQRITDIIQQPIELWQNHLTNDFENAIFPNHPEVKAVKTQLYDAGAQYASMTGSGAAVYGLFEHKPILHEFKVMKW